MKKTFAIVTQDAVSTIEKTKDGCIGESKELYNKTTT